ncbi:MAG: class I SAM-dependent methyltransferase [Bacteroidetes bacterium]|nr:class I SAM-dependent methyltransferase [Bacteroidota bacterium]
MREDGLERLSNLDIPKNSAIYIHLHYLFADLRKFTHAFSKGRLLDIGCGNKPYESFFDGLVNEYIGCDVVQSSLNKVDVICEATNLKFPDEFFDTVFSTQVIEHVGAPQKMISEAFRVIKPGGFMILSAPFCWELHEEPYDFYRYSKYGLKAIFEQAGFEVLLIQPNGGKWAAIFQMNLNMIYSSFKKKSLFRKILKGIFINLHFTAFINKLALWMDRKYYDELLTLNYVIVARKK